MYCVYSNFEQLPVPLEDSGPAVAIEVAFYQMYF